MEALSVVDIIGENIRTLRVSQGWSQADLADRMTARGVGIDRATVAKIERGLRKRVSTEEALGFALVLEVAPVYLLAPTDGEQPVALGDHPALAGRTLRHWIQGVAPLPDMDQQRFYSNVPAEDFMLGRYGLLAPLHQITERLVAAYETARLAGDDDRVDAIDGLLARLADDVRAARRVAENALAALAEDDESDEEGGR